MAKAVWNVEVNDNQHEIVLEWTYFGGERSITVDGKVVDEDDQPLRWKSKQMFDIDGEPFAVVTKPQSVNVTKFDIQLHRGDEVLLPDHEER